MNKVLKTGVAALLAICGLVAAARGAENAAASRPAAASPAAIDSTVSDWTARWERNITSDSRNRYCDRETGEELGWLVSPFLNGFYYGYLSTGDTKWIDMLVDWADAVIKRAQKEPDGCLGWPKDAGASTSAVEDTYTDNELGEAMMLKPLVLMAGVIRKDAALKEKYGRKADEYVALSADTFRKWDSRGAWREVAGGGVWVVPPFGIDRKTGSWTDGFARRASDGFTLPANKQNLVAGWLLAMYDVTGKPLYRDRAEKWFEVMKSRMRTRDGGRFSVWNYWDPAGPWDYKPDGATRHWVGVHPNGGYYGIDVEGIVSAYEHHLVFTKGDIDRLISTNRDFMWNGRVAGARFERIDGGEPDKRWADSPGVLWTALVPYDSTLRSLFEANHNPASWGGLSETPRYLARLRGERVESGQRATGDGGLCKSVSDMLC